MWTFTVFKSGFYISNNRSLNSFASKVIKISEEYIKFLIYRGRISNPDDLSPFDIAVDLTAELFKLEDGYLIHFRNFYEKLDVLPDTEDEFYDTLRRFIIAVTLNNLPQIYRRTDTVTHKILRNLTAAYKEENFIVTELFTDKYLHRKPVDFGSAECMDKDKLLSLVFRENGAKMHNAKDLLNLIFRIIESQNDYLHAVSFNNLMQILREIAAMEFKYRYTGEDSNAETKLHYKLLFEEIRRGFTVKLNNYFIKKNFSEKERDCVYSIVEDVLGCYINGNSRESVKNLIEKRNPGGYTKSFFNKVEYILGLLNNEIISLLQKEEKNNVKLLSE